MRIIFAPAPAKGRKRERPVRFPSPTLERLLVEDTVRDFKQHLKFVAFMEKEVARMPAKSKAQQRLMGADLQRAREGKKTVTGMSEANLEEMATTPKGKKLPERKGKK